jgi:hypothetical protein
MMFDVFLLPGPPDQNPPDSQSADEAAPDATGSSGDGSGALPLPPGGEAAVLDPCGSPHCTSSSGCGHGSLAGQHCELNEWQATMLDSVSQERVGVRHALLHT